MDHEAIEERIWTQKWSMAVHGAILIQFCRRNAHRLHCIAARMVSDDFYNARIPNALCVCVAAILSSHSSDFCLSFPCLCNSSMSYRKSFISLEILGCVTGAVHQVLGQTDTRANAT